MTTDRSTADYEEAVVCFNRCRAKGLQGSNTDGQDAGNVPVSERLVEALNELDVLAGEAKPRGNK